MRRHHFCKELFEWEHVKSKAWLDSRFRFRLGVKSEWVDPLLDLEWNREKRDRWNEGGENEKRSEW